MGIQPQRLESVLKCALAGDTPFSPERGKACAASRDVCAGAATGHRMAASPRPDTSSCICNPTDSMTPQRIYVKLTQAGHVELQLHPERPSAARRAGPLVGAAQRQPQELGGLR